MKPSQSKIAVSIERFVADIAAIIRGQAERAVADALVRHGLSQAAPAERRQKPKRARRAAATRERDEPTPSQRRPQQLTLF